MDDKGVSFISSRPLHSDNNIYVNQAFQLDAGDKSESLPNLAIGNNNSRPSGLKDDMPPRSMTPPTSAPPTPPALKSAMAGGAGKATAETGGAAPSPRPAPFKRADSSVDFFIPNDKEKAQREKDRKSISDTGPYRGMGKEELLRYSSKPFWRNLRYVCVLMILTGWLALLITLVAIVLTYPQCQKAQERDWWQKTVVYRIYVRSFFDTDGDGIGDLQGIREKLDYLEDIGVNTISLSPIYQLATDAVSDTSIVNHTAIDPVYGDMAQFRNLVDETHNRSMKIILDFIPNHTSHEHPWFINSNGASPGNTDSNADEYYRSYYVWATGSGSNKLRPPNNWISVTGCKAWKKSDVRNHHYFHQFTEDRPDLNLRSQKVRDELQDILKFWLDLKVDGFYIRDSDYLFEDYDLRDEAVVVDNVTKDENNCVPYEALNHTYTKGLREVFDMLARWRFFLNDYGHRHGSYRILLADVDGSIDHVMSYYGFFNRDGVDMPLNGFSLEVNPDMRGVGVGQMVRQWMRHKKESDWPNWMSGDDRSARMADRLGGDFAKPYMMLAMLLPGTPYFYYGDEIGLTSVSLGGPVQPGSGDMPMRNPMSWNLMEHAGFCKKFCPQPWLPVNPDYSKGVNVQDQQANPNSILNLFRNLTDLRTGKVSFEYGDYVPLLENDEEVFAFVREFDGEKGYLVALNFANVTVSKQLTGTHDTIPSGAVADVVTGGKGLHSRGSRVGLDPIHLAPYEGVVVSWKYKAKEP